MRKSNRSFRLKRHSKAWKQEWNAITKENVIARCEAPKQSRWPLWIALRCTLAMTVIISLLSACTLSPVAVPQQNLYILQPTRLNIAKSKRINKTIIVLPTESSAILKDTNMLYSTTPQQINYFGVNRWAARPAKMLTQLIADALQQSNRFKAVVLAPISIQTDYRLQTRLVTLQQNFYGNHASVQMVVHAELLSNNNDRIFAARNFSATVPAPSADPRGGVIAANRATQKILAEIVQFCVRNT